MGLLPAPNARFTRGGGIEKALSNLLKSVYFLLHLCLCGHNVDDFLSTFIIPYFHTYVNGYHQIKEPKVKRIERGLRPARLYYFVRLVFANCAFALSYAKNAQKKIIIRRCKSWKVPSQASTRPSVIAPYAGIIALQRIIKTVTMHKTLKARL